MRVARIPIGFVEGKFGPEKASSNFLIPKFAEIFKWVMCWPATVSGIAILIEVFWILCFQPSEVLQPVGTDEFFFSQTIATC